MCLYLFERITINVNKIKRSIYDVSKGRFKNISVITNNKRNLNKNPSFMNPQTATLLLMRGT